jgi:hypothetical protein
MSNEELTNLKQAVAAIYRRDPKRAGLIIAATVAMVGLSVRLILATGASHANANVAAPSHNQVTTADAGSSEYIKPGVATSSADPNALSAWLNTERHAPRRNLFAVDRGSNLAQSTTAGTPSQTAQQTKEDSGIWDEVAKSMATQADQGSERQRSHLAYLRRQAAGELKLSRIVPGPPPAACVNGGLVGEGSVVASYRVLKIETRRIIVEREGIPLDVPLN